MKLIIASVTLSIKQCLRYLSTFAKSSLCDLGVTTLCDVWKEDSNAALGPHCHILKIQGNEGRI